VFADCEKERIEGILEKIRQLCDKSDYITQETYKQALKYIKYLNLVINGQTDETPKTFITGYEPEQLKTIRERLIKAKIIGQISEKEFVYLFTAKPISKTMKRLDWKESRPLGHEFLKRVVYSKSNFDFNQVNDCIKSKDGKLFDSNCKSTAPYKCNIKLNPILAV
ncbi:MAG: hypothetical protein Q8T08_24680, partial [Ignavibacteria bacterium]|nr:hypothetical protein [Ignavibacteria bacterium]